MRNIILNIPHSSIQGIFDPEIGRWAPNPHFVNDCVNRWTDWWTDMLFPSDDERIKAFVFPYSRFVCDAERLENDPMEEKGQGILYTSFDGYKRRELTGDGRERLLAIRKDYLRRIGEALTEDSVLVDCHSFPGDLSEVDVCIGFNDDCSYDQELTDFVIDTFRRYGYKVGINIPFSNSLTPKVPASYASIMIEVNKKTYMNEKLLMLKRNRRQWMRWFGCIKEIYEGILPDIRKG